MHSIKLNATLKKKKKKDFGDQLWKEIEGIKLSKFTCVAILLLYLLFRSAQVQLRS